MAQNEDREKKKTQEVPGNIIALINPQRVREER